jgi:hypothetical protein
MTLREQLENCPDKDGWINKNHTRGINLEKIADEFAIGFAEWLLIIYNEDIIYDAYTKEELLEIYKNENNL